MSGLLSLGQAAQRLGCRDRRTARRRLEELGVAVEEYSGRIYVDEQALYRARAAHARPLRSDASAYGGGVVLPPGARLWDAHPSVNRMGGLHGKE